MLVGKKKKSMQFEAGVEEIPPVILTSDQSVCNKQKCKNYIFHC